MAGLAKYLPNVEKLRHADGDVDVKSLAGKTVFFYFSASWCPPCRGFTPQLAEFYQKYHKSKNFEVVFFSYDKQEEDYESYYAKMPWLALPYDQMELVKKVGKDFGLQSIPTLIGVDADTGDVVTMRARDQVAEDPEGEQYPWKDSQ